VSIPKSQTSTKGTDTASPLLSSPPFISFPPFLFIDGETSYEAASRIRTAGIRFCFLPLASPSADGSQIFAFLTNQLGTPLSP